MSHEQGVFSAPDKEEIFYQCWLPEPQPESGKSEESESKAALIVVHGVAEHSGRYMNLVNAMVPRGFSVYGLDHYGHGRSGGKRLFVPEFRVFTHCLDTLVDRVKEWEPKKKIFLVGHSMGGLITASYLTRHQDKLNGALFSGPAVKVPDNISPVTLLAARLFSKLVPGLGIKQLEAARISRDPEVVRAYINDPLVSTGKLTARLAEQLLHACLDLEKQAGQIRLPLLILQGGSDALVDPDGANAFHKKVSSPDKALKIYPEKYHEIFNDPGHDQVFADMTNWLAQRLG